MATTEELYRGAIILLGVLGLFAGLYMAQNVFAPLLTAVVVGVVFSPLANAFERLKFPSVATAICVLVVCLTVILLAGIMLEPPVTRLIERAPLIWAKVQYEISEIQAFLSGLEEFSEELTDAVGNKETREVVEAASDTTLMSALSFAPTVLGQIVIFIGALFFFVLTRRDIYVALTRLGRNSSARDQIAERIVETERFVSRYFATVTLINIGLGVATYVVLVSIGLPSPLLWAVLATFLNFVPYLGPAILAVSLGIAGIVVFDGAMSILPAAAFVTLNMIEGQFITPSFVGRQMQVNALLVFVSLVFWLWLWGPIGGFVAIPVLLAATAMLKGPAPGQKATDPLAEAA